MSRSIDSRSCQFCPGTPVIDGPPMRFFDYKPLWADRITFATLTVAHATCPLCEAKYAAWLNWPEQTFFKSTDTFVELSFWSTFNDEPGPEDLPTYEIEVRTEHIRKPFDKTKSPYWREVEIEP